MAKLVSDLLVEVKDLLNETTTDNDAKIIRAMNRRFKSMKFAFVKSKEAYFETETSYNIVANTRSVAISAAFVRISTVYYCEDSTSEKRLAYNPELKNASFDEVETSDIFSEYFLKGNNIVFVNLPTTSVTNGLKVKGVISLETNLASTDTVPMADDFTPALIYGTVFECSLGMKDQQNINNFKALYDESVKEIKQVIHQRVEHYKLLTGFDPDRI